MLAIRKDAGAHCPTISEKELGSVHLQERRKNQRVGDAIRFKRGRNTKSEAVIQEKSRKVAGGKHLIT
ncbi:MAG: hypothetical protein J7K94_02900 [Dehalococcoidia bacterium]|nr:hypothetical protein [Dehalococcoidia bacterium]